MREKVLEKEIIILCKKCTNVIRAYLLVGEAVKMVEPGLPTGTMVLVRATHTVWEVGKMVEPGFPKGTIGWFQATHIVWVVAKMMEPGLPTGIIDSSCLFAFWWGPRQEQRPVCQSAHILLGP